jgi:pilus assembly protein Flp/PilA
LLKIEIFASPRFQLWSVDTGTLAERRRLLNQENTTMTLIARFLRDEAGATAIEYGLIAAGISVAIIATVAGLGSKLNSTFTSVQNALN